MITATTPYELDPKFPNLEGINRYEHIFAVDGSGFNCKTKSDYYADKHHKKKENDWCDAHVIVGVNSNIVTSVFSAHKYKRDELDTLPYLIKHTQRNFGIDYLLGDGGYLCEDKMEMVLDEFDVLLFVPIKKNTRLDSPGKGVVWKENIRLNLSEIWNEIYHPRSNVESTFFAVKGGGEHESIKSKKEENRLNELLGKFVIYNINRLIIYYYVAGIKPDFVTRTKIEELTVRK